MFGALRGGCRRGSRRVDENRALRALFSGAVPIVSDPALAARLSEAAEGSDDDLTIPALESGNQALRELLIALHAYVENADGEEARQLEAEIWRELAASTERRRFSLSVF